MRLCSWFQANLRIFARARTGCGRNWTIPNNGNGSWWDDWLPKSRRPRTMWSVTQILKQNKKKRPRITPKKWHSELCFLTTTTRLNKSSGLFVNCHWSKLVSWSVPKTNQCSNSAFDGRGLLTLTWLTFKNSGFLYKLGYVYHKIVILVLFFWLFLFSLSLVVTYLKSLSGVSNFFTLIKYSVYSVNLCFFLSQCLFFHSLSKIFFNFLLNLFKQFKLCQNWTFLWMVALKSLYSYILHAKMKNVA